MTMQLAAATSLKVNAPLVVSETMDGEAIVMHHGSSSSTLPNDPHDHLGDPAVPQ